MLHDEASPQAICTKTAVEGKEVHARHSIAMTNQVIPGRCERAQKKRVRRTALDSV